MNPFHLNQKTTLVTGAGSGIGRAVAELFADQGARVWVVDLDEAAASETVTMIRAADGWAEYACANVSSAADVTALEKRVGPVDVLVNNAGVGHVGTLLDTTHEDLDRLYAVNVRGVFLCAKAFATGMIGRGRGSVVNMASIGGIVAVRERLAYTTTKFAVVGITKALALDHSHTGVRFNCICPGRVETPFVKKRLSEYPDPEQAYRDMASTQLNGRMAQPGEVAAAALYLASDASAMVTGSSLMIDGGWSAGK
ncbi:MAG TPA: glucose 1-dehydrogenase [Polyangiaceae bacterium]|jgi:NAD(P)-dependent dehydrogenase (short-subunit alcohol dehydrogenase family)